jgi:molecular chaperone DnaJ
VPIGITTAALGGTIQVPTLGGKAEIELPEGVQAGKVFRLRGKGIKGVRSAHPGDLYAHIAVETPVRLTDKQKQILRDLDQSLSDARHSPQTRSWKDRVKEFFQ